jgi:hypothetical protein
MTFKRNLLTLSVFAVFSQLSACGGGGGEDTPQVTPEPPAATPTQSLTGTTADGYLVGAKVCVDLNANGDCDQDEPSTLTIAGGKYAFSDLAASIDLSKHPLLVEVIAGQTIDEDEPGVAIETGYTMTAPAGINGFISPLSTLLAANVANGTAQELAEAIKILETKLGIEGTGTDLLQDYVAGSNSASGDEYKRLHRVAQIIARVLAKAIDEVNQNGGTGGDATKKEIVHSVRAQLAANIEQVANIIDSLAGTNTPIDIKILAQTIQEQLAITPASVQEQVEKRREQSEKQTTNVLSLLQQEGGLFYPDGHEYREFDPTNQQCIVEHELSYEQVRESQGKITILDYLLNNLDTGFELQQNDQVSNTLRWQNGQWNAADESMTVSSVHDDGSLTINSSWEGEIRVYAEKIDLAQHKIHRLVDDIHSWKQVIAHENVFPNGVEGYKVKLEQINEVYSLPLGDNCSNDGSDERGNCNLVYAGADTPATSYEALLTPTSAAQGSADNPKLLKSIFLAQAEHKHLVVSLIGELSAAEGKANYFLFKPQDCASGRCDEAHFIGQAKWKLNDRGIELALPSSAKSWIEQDEFYPNLSLYEGFIRRSYTQKAGKIEVLDWGFNAQGMESIIESIKPDKLRVIKDPEYCGIEDDADQAKPEIISDAVNTERLNNHYYFVDKNDFRGLVHFKQGGVAELWSEDREEEPKGEYQTGYWKINAEQQLLIGFDEDDWVLLQVIEDSLAQDEMFVKEGHGDEWEHFLMINAVPLQPETLLETPTFLFGSLMDPDCTMSYQLNIAADNLSQGNGSVDMSQCQHRNPSSNTHLELTWWQQQALGPITIQRQDTQGTASDTKHKWFRLNNDEQDRILDLGLWASSPHENRDEWFEVFQFKAID